MADMHDIINTIEAGIIECAKAGMGGMETANGLVGVMICQGCEVGRARALVRAAFCSLAVKQDKAPLVVSYLREFWI